MADEIEGCVMPTLFQLLYTPLGISKSFPVEYPEDNSVWMADEAWKACDCSGIHGVSYR